MSARGLALVVIGGAAGVVAWLAFARPADAAGELADGGAGFDLAASLAAVFGGAGSTIAGAVPDSALDVILPGVYGVENVFLGLTGERMRMSEAGLAALVAHEGVGPGSVRGVSHVPYQDQAGKWTIGYGHLIQPWESFTSIGEADALALRQADLRIAEDAVNSAVSVSLTQPMFDALVDLVFNIGVGAFRNSTLLRLLNAGDYAGARDQFYAWDKVTINGVRQVSAGLAARRDFGAQLFASGGGVA